MIRKIIFLLPMLLFQLVSSAQEKPTVEMADVMRNNGKIYVVVAVIITIFAMIILYLVRLEKKINKLEKNNNS